jgi:L-2-hydroxyglutarate oxidase LhgO
MSETVDCIVVGAGVVGLAVARVLALAGREVIVLEREGGIGAETSSRNSEVIHAGIYYPKDSLKARFCVAGNRALYAYCAARGIAHRRLGKLIVACDEAELAGLAKLKASAEANGVPGMRWLSAAEARQLEPALSCVGALLSPSTGILDSHALMLAYQGEAEAAGAVVAFHAPVWGGRVSARGVELDIGGAEALRLDARLVVNCAGLHAPALARAIAGMPPERVPQGRLCKGVYFTLAGRAPFGHLIYPAPEKAGLGVHLTLDLAGQARFGPDTEWVERIDYSVDPRRGERFYAAIRRYWPALPDGALQPGYAGIRPKIVGPNEPAGDFVVQGPREHGLPGLVNLFGIESPGLTSSLPLADHVLSVVAAARPAPLAASAAAR